MIFFCIQSLIDEYGYKEIQGAVDKMQQQINQGLWLNATEQWGQVQNAVGMQTNGVNFYNILKWGAEEAHYSSNKFNVKGMLWIHILILMGWFFFSMELFCKYLFQGECSTTELQTPIFNPCIALL